MTKQTLAVKIDPEILERMRQYCAQRGVKQGFFVEKALLAKMDKEEIEEDLMDLKRNKSSESLSMSFEDYLKLRNV